MSDTFALADLPGAGADRPVDERGMLDVRTKALEQIVRGAALGIEDLVTHSAGIQKLAGGSYPSASVSFSGQAARVQLDVAAVWPCRLHELAATTRDRVHAEASRLSGTEIIRLDVTVHVVTPDSTTTSRRRVQ